MSGSGRCVAVCGVNGLLLGGSVMSPAVHFLLYMSKPAVRSDEQLFTNRKHAGSKEAVW